MINIRPKMCMLAATPLTIQFFLKPHIISLSRYFDTTLAFNPRTDAYLPPLELPVRQVAVGIERKMSPLKDLSALYELVRFFHRERFELLVTLVPKAGLLGMLAAFFTGVPMRVHIFQGEVWASKRGPMRLLLKSMDRVTAALATHVLAVGHGEREFLEEEGVVRRGQAQVLGAGSIAGVAMERFRPDAAMRCTVRKQLAVPEEAVLCLCLGRMNADKGVKELVEAFALSAPASPDLWLALVGPDEDGMVPRLLEGLSPELALRVVVEGYTDKPEAYLAAADFLCLPSYREGFVVVVLEASATGIPVIGSRIYGVRDALVDEETGLFFEPGDVRQLAAAIERLAGDKRLRKRFGEAGRARIAREFNQEQVVGRYVAFFRRLFDGGVS